MEGNSEPNEDETMEISFSGLPTLVDWIRMVWARDLWPRVVVCSFGALILVLTSIYGSELTHSCFVWAFGAVALFGLLAVLAEAGDHWIAHGKGGALPLRGTVEKSVLRITQGPKVRGHFEWRQIPGHFSYGNNIALFFGGGECVLISAKMFENRRDWSLAEAWLLGGLSENSSLSETPLVGFHPEWPEWKRRLFVRQATFEPTSSLDRSRRCRGCFEEIHAHPWDWFKGFLVECPKCRLWNGQERHLGGAITLCVFLNFLGFFNILRPRYAAMISTFFILMLVILELTPMLPDHILIPVLLLVALIPGFVGGILALIHNEGFGRFPKPEIFVVDSEPEP